MGDVERDAALEAIADLYGSIGRPFQILSVRAERDPGEHLAAMAEHAEGRRIEKALAAYGALYREVAAAQRRLRRTYLLLDAPSEPGTAAGDRGAPALCRGPRRRLFARRRPRSSQRSGTRSPGRASATASSPG